MYLLQNLFLWELVELEGENDIFPKEAEDLLFLIWSNNMGWGKITPNPTTSKDLNRQNNGILDRLQFGKKNWYNFFKD